VGHILQPEFFPDSLLRPQQSTPPAALSPDTGSASQLLPGVHALVGDLLHRREKDIYPKVLEAVERVVLSEVLQQTHGHQTQASELLGLNRATLRHKLRSLGLAVDKTVTDESRTEE
jgi:two-component system nitrogen regulation response regulator GlnG